MIFAVPGHIRMIINRRKTQTRRDGRGIYEVGKTYAIQPGRTKPGILDGRIGMLFIRRESYPHDIVCTEDAFAEGGYTPREFEDLYYSLYPKQWRVRYAFTFEFVPTRLNASGFYRNETGKRKRERLRLEAFGGGAER